MSTLHSPIDYAQLEPSAYTAALIQAIRQQELPDGPVCEVGVGSGVCLLALAEMGYHELSGCDLNEICVNATRQMLHTHAQDVVVDIRAGNLWQAFDAPKPYSVIIANLPHFPGQLAEDVRMDNWRGGDGRAIMDRFLLGLPDFLAPDGVALITHHDLVGLSNTETMLSRLGLHATCVSKWTVYESSERMSSVSNPDLIKQCKSAYQIGPYWFMESRILRIEKITK